MLENIITFVLIVYILSYKIVFSVKIRIVVTAPHIYVRFNEKRVFVSRFFYSRVGYAREEVTRLGERSKLHVRKNSSSVLFSQLFLIYRV